jgi:hypothetical protein
MEALELLKQDHQKVKELFEQAEDSEAGTEQKRILGRSKRSWRPMPGLKNLFFTLRCKSTRS